MDMKLKKLAVEAINLELYAGELYTIFSGICPTDSNFWRQLAEEESNHATLIQNGLQYFFNPDLFSEEMLDKNLENVRAINQKLKKSIDQYTTKPPSREMAFAMALEVEHSAIEAHYQNMITCEDVPKEYELLQRLNSYDKDHVKRIQAYMKEKGIH